MNDHRTVTLTLPTDVLLTLEDLAAIQGTSLQEMATSLLSDAVAQSAIRGHGRCSLRTGLKTEGPRPLPLQQP